MSKLPVQFKALKIAIIKLLSNCYLPTLCPEIRSIFYSSSLFEFEQVLSKIQRFVISKL